MYKCFIGIDPGLTGALASINCDGDSQIMRDLPTSQLNKLKWVDGILLLEILREARGDTPPQQCLITLEQTGVIPKNGAIAANSMGRTLGSILATIQISGIPFHVVQPARWKSVMKVPTEKDGARQKAIQLFPGFRDELDRKKDHNRAEAALLAYYGCAFGALAVSK